MRTNTMRTQMKEISSSLTFFYKYIVLAIWTIGFGFGTRDILLAGPDDPRWLQYSVIWIVFGAFIYFSAGNIKKVILNKDHLLVSNFLRTEKIPVTEVAAVDGSAYLSPKLVWFELKKPCGFGKKIHFIPERRMSPGIGKHPLVAELNRDWNL